MFDLASNKELLEKVFARFQMQWHIYQKMYYYYCGITDTGKAFNATQGGAFDDPMIDNFIDAEGAGNYNFVNDRFNNRINTNFVKRFVKEEVSYSVGNDITYISKSSNDDIVNTLKYNLAHWKEDHDSVLAKNMLIYSTAYELYYLDKNADFCSRVISPRHGFAYTDNCGNIIFFLHIFRNAFDPKMYIDIYTDNEIIHCDETFTEASRQPHLFGEVPVGIANLSEEGWLDSVYHDIKTLQDAYETNLSDISQEITEFRNAYLAFKNAQVDETDLPEMKKNGIIQFKGDGSAEWLVKNINDTFIQNTLTTLQEVMYKIAAHIDTNEKASSNTSSLALRAKLISLEEKCKLNQKALSNCIKTRNRMLFHILNNLKNTNYDYKDIKIKYTANIPSDDFIMAQTIAQLGDKISIETAVAQLSFVDNPKEEKKKLEEQNKANSIGNNLLNPPIKTEPVVVNKQ
ncbi:MULTISPECIES: phage portal protein [Clostridium]|uniref:Phage portal protein n=1 Tax=Clostridium frigoriphilum TaxID=443253 RepID=A0ABU7UJ80_9CLOT|nr:phage portal protein [Clostridium sp. DSM 17811]MBU3098373.1 phage portal protein [Clostridium sp. DSM 17811]